MSAPLSAYLGCGAGDHWACSARNTITIQCHCPCHRYDLGRSHEFQCIRPYQLLALGY